MRPSCLRLISRSACLVLLAGSLLACLSSPPVAADPSVADETAADGSAAAGAEAAGADFFRLPDLASFQVALPEPVLNSPPASLPDADYSVDLIAPDLSGPDITVLAPSLSLTAVLPEPVQAAPLPIAPVTPPAAATASRPAPALTRPVAPASAPVVSAPVSESASATTTHPPASTVVPPPVASEAAPTPPLSQLPAPPASSARTETAVEAPQAFVALEATRGQAFDIRFRGAGWTYLGDEEGRPGIRFEGRLYDNNEVFFTLDPEQVGEYMLRFRRQNPLNQQMESSLVQVKVIAPGPQVAAVRRLDGDDDIDVAVFPAGEWPRIYAAAAAASGSSSPAGPTTAAASARPPVERSSTAAAVPQTSPTAGAPAANATTSSPVAAAPAASSAMPAPTTTNTAAPASPVVAPVAGTTEMTPATQSANQPVAMPDNDPAGLLGYARTELASGRVQNSLAALDRYVAADYAASDELFFLYGLAYEQDTPFRNIRLAHQNYKRLRDEYPRSQFRQQAIERIAWMERHFFGLR